MTTGNSTSDWFQHIKPAIAGGLPAAAPYEYIIRMGRWNILELSQSANDQVRELLCMNHGIHGRWQRNQAMPGDWCLKFIPNEHRQQHRLDQPQDKRIQICTVLTALLVHKLVENENLFEDAIVLADEIGHNNSHMSVRWVHQRLIIANRYVKSPAQRLACVGHLIDH